MHADQSHPSNQPNVEQAHKPTNHSAKTKETAKNIFSTLGIFLLAPLVAVLLTTFIFQSYQVDGQSMEKTLFNGDRLIVYKLPRTWAKITNHTYIPKRGDIVIFSEKASALQGDSDRQLIKRVIGLPGDRVVVKNGEVRVYNNAHPKGFDPDNTTPSTKLASFTSGSVDVKVLANEIFVLGDNRANSLDSRVFGPIKSDIIVGKLVARLYPFNMIDSF